MLASRFPAMATRLSGILTLALWLAVASACGGDGTDASDTDALAGQDATGDASEVPAADTLPADTQAAEEVATGDVTCPGNVTTIRFPEDEAPHPGATEWWYYTGHLKAANGDRYGYELTVFQAYPAPGLVGYPGHFAITDFQKKVHVYDQKLFLPPNGTYTTFDLRVDSWSIRGDGTADHLKGDTPGYAYELTCTPTKAPAPHGDGGVIAMGSDQDSWYYSKTRMDVTGTLTVDGKDLAVTGLGWMDHQWGTFDVFKSNGWDWFSIQLDDDTEVMLYLLHFKDGHTGLTGGSIVDANGCRRPLAAADVQATGSWTSPRTSAVYPMGWTFKVPSEGLDLTVTTEVEDQEMDTWATTMNVYWEGAVNYAGTHAGKAVTGQGYVELAGYGPWGQ